MKQFSLEEYLKNPSRKVVTRGGRNARIICTDAINSDYPIVTLIEMEGREIISSNTKDGKCFDGKESCYDLCFASEKKEGWVNIYKNNNSSVEPFIYQSKEDAKYYGMNFNDYVTTVKIEWEE